MELEYILRQLYREEINITISSYWDNGWRLIYKDGQREAETYHLETIEQVHALLATKYNRILMYHKMGI